MKEKSFARTFIYTAVMLPSENNQAKLISKFNSSIIQSSINNRSPINIDDICLLDNLSFTNQPNICLTKLQIDLYYTIFHSRRSHPTRHFELYIQKLLNYAKQLIEKKKMASFEWVKMSKLYEKGRVTAKNKTIKNISELPYELFNKIMDQAYFGHYKSKNT